MDKYSHRRQQIIEKFDDFKQVISDIRSSLNVEEILLDIGEQEKSSSKKLAFVDGGEGIRELLGVGIYLIRASCLIIASEEGSEKGEVFERDVDMNIIDYDKNLKDRVELLREGMEFDVALKSVKKHSPSHIFLDGSLYVKARRDPIRCPEYEIYRKKFVRLLKYCKQKQIHVIGVSEDSKSRLLSTYLSKKNSIKFPPFMTDSTLLNVISEKSTYRTLIFTPQSRFEADEMLSVNLKASFQTCYLKTTEISNPLRIDVPDWENDFISIIRLIKKLSKGSKSYGYPLPLYLVHLDARIRPSQTEWTTKQIVSYITKHDQLLGNAVLGKSRRMLRPD